MAQQVPIHLPVRDANPGGRRFCPCLVLRTRSHPGGTLSFNISGRACGCEARLPFWERRVRSSPLLCPYVFGTWFFVWMIFFEQQHSMNRRANKCHTVPSFSFCFKHLKRCELVHKFWKGSLSHADLQPQIWGKQQDSGDSWDSPMDLQPRFWWFLNSSYGTPPSPVTYHEMGLRNHQSLWEVYYYCGCRVQRSLCHLPWISEGHLMDIRGVRVKMILPLYKTVSPLKEVNHCRILGI